MQMDTGMVSMLEYDKDEGVPQGKQKQYSTHHCAYGHSIPVVFV
jgi:hypothetical protein